MKRKPPADNHDSRELINDKIDATGNKPFVVPDSHITHVCCCGQMLYRQIRIGSHWLCRCGAKWLKTKTDMQLCVFGFKSCFECYYRDMKQENITGEPAQKNYIKSHCRHARALIEG